MTFAQATEYLYALVDYERTPAEVAAGLYLNLDRMRATLALAGDPQRALRVAHIAGTKGKGSTAAMLASILRAADRHVGLYTKPHLITYR
jgi:dihydrofolate synthase / folylpolyglutamate synthase